MISLGQAVNRAMRLTVPVGNVLISDSGSHIEHDDTTLSVDIIAIAKTSKLLLASSVPDIKGDRAEVLIRC